MRSHSFFFFFSFPQEFIECFLYASHAFRVGDVTVNQIHVVSALMQLSVPLSWEKTNNLEY